MSYHEEKSLSVIGRFIDGIDICTADLMKLGASVYGLTHLEKAGLVDGIKIRRAGKWWRITEAGRAALKEMGE